MSDQPDSDIQQMADNIRIDVQTVFLSDQSDALECRFVFAYTITIHNDNALPVQLLTRRWLITDANGKIQQVEGDGVVGQQPRIFPGQYYRYSSGAMLDTPVGTMAGQYGMLSDDGLKFSAPIPVFRLAVPGVVH